MCKILLSIKPEHVKNILCGVKKFEYRRIAPQKDIDAIVIYSTSPEMKVVAEVNVVKTHREYPMKLWGMSKLNSGISEQFFRDYYSDCIGKKEIIAFELGDVNVFDTPKELHEFGISTAPQSFVYLENS